MMRIVAPKKRRRPGSYAFRTAGPEAWDVLLEVAGKDVPANLPLTAAAIERWKTAPERIAPCNYARFDGLGKADILSIISATKRQEVRINVDRWGRAAYYKLLKHAKSEGTKLAMRH